MDRSYIGPIVGHMYRHYKGRMYRVLHIGKNKSDEKLQVIYIEVNTPSMYPWIRDLDNWNKRVSFKSGSNTNTQSSFSISRFTPVFSTVDSMEPSKK